MPSWKAIDQAPENTKKRRKPQQPDPERWCWVSLTKCVVCLHLLRIQANGRCALCELFVMLSRRIQPMIPLPAGRLHGLVPGPGPPDLASGHGTCGQAGGAGRGWREGWSPLPRQLQALLLPAPSSSLQARNPNFSFCKACPAQAGNLISRVKRLATLRVAAACLLLALPRSAALFTLTARSGSELF